MCKATGPCDCENCRRLRREESARQKGAMRRTMPGGEMNGPRCECGAMIYNGHHCANGHLQVRGQGSP